MTAAVDPAKLAKLLALASSDNEAEARAALRKARECCATLGLTPTGQPRTGRKGR